MPHVFTRPRAEADLVDIWRYIAQDSPVNADRMLDRISETLSRLAAMPFMGQARAFEGKRLQKQRRGYADSVPIGDVNPLPTR